VSKEFFAGGVEYGKDGADIDICEMKRPAPVRGKLWIAIAALSMGAPLATFAGDLQTDQPVRQFPQATNLFQLRQAVAGDMGSICAFSLEGIVLAANPESGAIFLQDDTGIQILETSVAGRALQPGQRVRLCGTNYVASTEIGVSLGRNPVVDNDCRHSKSERAASLYLKAGLYPIRVLWFNYTWDWSLGVEYSGPGFARQTVPDSKLFRFEDSPSVGTRRLVNGLSYQCFEGQWEKLPAFESLTPVVKGVVSNFSLSVKTRQEHVGLAFDGFIKLERDGLYTFYLASDDGSQLFIQNAPIQLTVAGAGAVPAPRQITVRQPLAGDEGPIWGEVEGTIAFLGRYRNRAELELISGDSRMRVVESDAPEEPPHYLLGSRVRIRGICTDTTDAGGHRLADTLVIPDWKNVQVLDAMPNFWSAAKCSKISGCKVKSGSEAPETVRICGTLHTGAAGELPNLEDQTGTVPVELLNSFPTQFTGEVECLGRWGQTGSNSVLREALWRRVPAGAENPEDTNDLPVLTTAAQVQQLKRNEARLGRRVRLRGVVTWVTETQDWIVLQDSTRGVSVMGLKQHWAGDAPRIGENLEVEGVCYTTEFSPFVILNRAKRLGMGQLPVPMHPTWEQLVGGSMDAQYVEIGGLVTGSPDDIHLNLLMADGRIDVEFYPRPASPLSSFIDSVVRIRGVTFAKWDSATHMLTPDHPLRFGSATICVDTPPPLDPFEADKMGARELMQFDVQRNTFQRVKVSGQFVGGRAGVCFITDNGFGLRLEPVQPVHFEAGDLVDAVGLVKLGGVSPILRRAIVRKTGHAALPPPEPLVFDGTNATYESSRVSVEGLLLDVKDTGSERVMEIQAGPKHFVARMAVDSEIGAAWPLGSRLKMTGVYSGVAGVTVEGQRVNSFELLLNSPVDVQWTARPPLWTLHRLLAMVAILAAGLATAFIWITLLHRQVERRSVELKREIGERQRAEQERAIERERSRIAGDLHDDLGSRLTAISMLAMTGLGAKATAEASRERLQLIADKARSMITTLDGLVWTVDPKNDTIGALAEYLASFAEEFLAKTNIVCRIEMPNEFPDQNVAAEARHNALLSVREALNNAVRHGSPSEVRLRLAFSDGELSILVADNGCGFDDATITPGNGLSNLNRRMRKVNGRCRIESSVGRGTTVLLTLSFAGRQEPTGLVVR